MAPSSTLFSVFFCFRLPLSSSLLPSLSPSPSLLPSLLPSLSPSPSLFTLLPRCPSTQQRLQNVDAEIQVLRRQADDARDQIVAKEATIAHLQRELYAIRRAGVEASLATLPKVRSSSAVEDGKGLVDGLAAATRVPSLSAPAVAERATRREGEQKEDEGLRSASTSTTVSAATVGAATASTAAVSRLSRVDPALRVASSEVRPRLAESASVAVEATPRVDGTARPRSLFDLAASDSPLSSPSAGVPSDPIEAARLASRLRRTERERR